MVQLADCYRVAGEIDRAMELYIQSIDGLQVHDLRDTLAVGEYMLAWFGLEGYGHSRRNRLMSCSESAVYVKDLRQCRLE